MTELGPLFPANADEVRVKMPKAFISAQPVTAAEIEDVRSILDICPTSSIGEDAAR